MPYHPVILIGVPSVLFLVDYMLQSNASVDGFVLKIVMVVLSRLLLSFSIEEKQRGEPSVFQQSVSSDSIRELTSNDLAVNYRQGVQT